MRRWIWWWVVSILLVGCTGQTPTNPASLPTTRPTATNNVSLQPPPVVSELAVQTAVIPATATPLPQFTAPPLSTPQSPQPTVPPAATNVRQHETEDYGFRQWATFDGIPPIYEPIFRPADAAPLQEDELVMGVTLGGEAKAYPITVLQFREMVNDELAGIPILVSW